MSHFWGAVHLHPLIPKPDGKGWKYTNPKKTILLGIVVAGSGYLVYQGVKDTIAIFGAPETGGASLLLLAVP